MYKVRDYTTAVIKKELLMELKFLAIKASKNRGRSVAVSELISEAVKDLLTKYEHTI